MKVASASRILVIIVGLMILMGSHAMASQGLAESENAEAEPSPSEPVRFVLEPAEGESGGAFRMEAEAGSQREVTAVFGNAGEEPVTALIYAADGTSSVNGGLNVASADAPQTGVTTWLGLAPETIDLAPGQRVERTFTVSVPSGTPPGEHVTTLVIQTAESVEIPGTETFRQVVRRASAFYINVPGESDPAFNIGAIGFVEEGGTVRFVASIQNTGNTRVSPTGIITFSEPGGDVVATAPVEMGPVFAFHETSLDIGFQNPPVPGEYEVDIELTDSETGASASVTDQTVTAPDLMATPVPPPPVTIQDIMIAPMPSADEIQYLDFGAAIRNTGEPVNNARLTLNVTRDGQPVENFVLAPSLSIPNGTTEINQRYLPAGGWEPGTYIFSLTLETVNPANGVATVLLSMPIDAEIEAP